MDGRSEPPSDVTTMGSENEESSVRRAEDSTAATTTSSPPSSTGSYPDHTSEYLGQGSIRAGSASPVPQVPQVPTSSSSPTGCGCVAATVVQPDEITITITPTTGGQFELTVDRTDTVENLKKIISKRLKVAKERICLLHRERQLREGTLEENRLQEGSRLTLLPSVETGLLAQRPEQSVMQALESLTDSQVNDFLSGKAPLNLTMRLGDHMMLIQLQLSTVTPASPNNNQTTASNTTGLTIGGNGSNGSSLGTSSNHVSSSLQSRRSTFLAARSTGSVSTKLQNGTAAARTSSLISSLASVLHASALRASALHTAASCSTSLSTATTTTSPMCSSRASTAAAAAAAAAAASSILSSISSASCSSFSSSFSSSSTTSAASSSATSSSSTSSATCSTSSLSSSSYSPPVSPPHSPFCNRQARSARPSVGSVLPTNNNNNSNNTNTNNSNNNSSSGLLPPYLLYRHRRYHSHHGHHHHHHHHHHSRCKPTSPTSIGNSSPGNVDQLQQSTSTGCADAIPYESAATPPRKKLCTAHHHPPHQQSGADASRSIVDVDLSPQSPTSSSSTLVDQTTKAATLDTRALAEASRNLTQKLKQLSSEVLTSRVDLAEENARRRQGAIIESMHHHGKGVYSGTFSGTLNPALQDRHGRPKRDTSTIIHILNDLLCATPAAAADHYRHHHRHSNDRQQSPASASSVATNSNGNGSTSPVGCHDSSTSGYSTEELSKENEATKGKMRRLRLVMEQRRAKRKARRQARAAPYTTQWAAVTPDPEPNHDPNTTTTSGTTGSNTAEPQNEPELQPCSPEPVVA